MMKTSEELQCNSGGAPMSSYPTDRKDCGYSIRYIKWLMQSGAVNEIGPDAFALLVAVVMTEDETFYQRPPNFFNDQLILRCGFGSEPAMMRARDRAVDAGLLNYKPGAKRRPGVYFVSGYANDSLANPERTVSESVTNRLPSIPIPIPIPKEKRPQFEKPSLQEIKDYCAERRNEVDPDRFMDYYTANGWIQGKGKPIRDWKAAVRSWEGNSFQKTNATASDEYEDFTGKGAKRA